MKRDRQERLINKIDQKRIIRLQEQLENSAFRHGTSAFRYGLIPQAPSDHLPITAQVTPTTAPSLNLMSWNLLADSHLYNNFMNISGSSLLADAIAESGEENLYFSSERNMLYHFFSELAQFLYKNKTDGNIVITGDHLKQFIELKNQPSRLTRSRDPIKAKKNVALIRKNRQMIIDLFLDTKHEHVAEFKLAIKHSLELIHHIKGEHGALQWSNRFKLISENQPLRLQMERMDFICLQECSSPDDLHKMMNARDERFAKLSYKTNPRTDDHCVILYDQQKFELERKVEYAIEGKKPSIFARFRPKDKPEQAFIVASIHYPGGDHELLETLIAQAHSLKSNANEKIEYFMLGDYNHTEAFFDKMGEKETHLFYPVRGTMAGSDYGNTNNAIDAVCTNVDSTQIDVRQLDALSHACPSSEKLDVSFESEQRPLITFKKDVKITPMATPNLTMFGHAVQSRVDASDARQAVKFLGTAESKRSTITVI